ncbi:MAG: YfhO family protein [bacterium]
MKKEIKITVYIFLIYIVLNHIFMYKLAMPSYNIFGTDKQVQGQVFYEATKKQTEESKEFPLWNNHILGGMPTQASFMASKQLLDPVYSALTYPIYAPFGFIQKIFNLTDDYGMIVNFGLFGTFMFMYLRLFSLSIFASFIGGLAFLSCAGFISLFYPGHITGKAVVIGNMPLILFFITLAFKKDSSKLLYFALAGLVYARQMTAHIQIFFLLSVSLVLYLFFKILFDYLEKRDWKRAGKYVVLSGVLFAMGFMLNADQLLPRLEFKKYTHRGSETKVSEMDRAAMPGVDPDLEKYYFVTSFSQPPEDLLGLFMRYPFGMGKPYGGVLKEVEGIPYYRGRYELRLSLEYVGIFVFLLAILGAIKYFRMREVKLIVILGIASLWLSLGKYTPLFDILYKMPGFKNFRIPLVYTMVAYFSFAALAGFGFNYLEEFVNKSKNGLLRKFIYVSTVVAGIVSILAIIGNLFEIPSINFLLNFELIHEMLWGIYADIRQRFALFMFNLNYFVVAFWLFILVLFLIYKKRLSVKAALLFFGLAISIDLWTLNNKFIITMPKTENVSQYMGEDNLVKFLKSDKSYFRIKSHVDEVNNRWLLFNISNIEGYHPTPLRNFENVYQLMNFTNNIDSLLNIKYLLLSPQDQLVQIVENNSFLKNKYRKVTETTSYSISAKTEKPVIVYENTQNLGRAFFVYAFGVVEDENQALGILANPTYNPKEAAILNEKPKQSFTLRKGSAEKIEFVKYTPNHVKINTENDGDALLILSENWYPAWKAYIDGNKTEVMRAYNTLRAVFVPAGKHKVEFKYQSETLFYGEVLFFIGMFLIIVALGYEGRRRGLLRKSSQSVSAL